MQSRPDELRRLLTEGDISATDKRVRFVTLEAYEAAGGIVRRDLFDERNTGYIADAALLDRLATEKLSAISDTVMAEGWKWAEARLPSFTWEETRCGYRSETGSPAISVLVILRRDEERERGAVETRLDHTWSA